MDGFNLFHGDCLELMRAIPDNSIDMVLTDPPYGTTGCKWDEVIPFDLMWKELLRVSKPNTAIALFGSEPFSSKLRMSNIKMFKYDWIWKKSKPANNMLAKAQPLKIHEIISVFSQGKAPYYPVGVKNVYKVTNQGSVVTENNGGGERKSHYVQRQERLPKTIIPCRSVGSTVHSTQKPVALLEYLIKTYTQKGEVVLDFTMGSGSTGVACKKCERMFIGIEKDDKYFNIASERISNA